MTFRRLPVAAAISGLLLAVSAASASAIPLGPDLRATGSTQTQVGFAWTAVERASSYQIQYSTYQDFRVGYTGVTYKQGTSTLVGGLRPGTAYNFRVRAIGFDKVTVQSGWSNKVVASTKKLLNLTVGTYNVKKPDSNDPSPWTTRGPLSAAAVIGQGVKLLGAQELYGEDDRLSFLSYVNQKAGGSYYAMVPSPGSDAGDDSRILYDKRSLRVISAGGVQYPTQNGSESRAFSWGRFQHLASGQYVYFVSTHLSPNSDSADVAQWKQLIGWLNNVRRALPHYKFIVTGDFNTTKFEPPATMLAVMRSNGYEDVLGQIRDSYSTYRNPGTRVDAWISTSNRGERDLKNGCRCIVSPDRNANSIDYVFVHKGLKVPYYRNYAQPRDGYVMRYLMSDHFLVKATVTQ